MTGDEMEALCKPALGRRWKPVLAEKLSVRLQTVNRWRSGFTPIPKRVELAIERTLHEADLGNA